jgi:ABC-type transport system substrate-binding protein
LQLRPNPRYYGANSFLEGLTIRFYPSVAALLEAFTSGEIQGIPHVPADVLPELAILPQARLVTSAAPRYSALLFNLSETGAAALRDTAVRQSLALALNRELLIDETKNGQGLLFDGPFLPGNWAYRPDVLTPIPSNPVSATLMLDDAGWILSAGESLRRREEESLSLRILTLSAAPNQELAEAVAAQWTQVGVGATVTAVSTADGLRENLSARDFDVALVEINPLADPDLYDFWSQEAIIRGQNYAGWNNRRASEALEEGRQLWTVAERRPYYESFLRIFANEIPAVTLYQHVDSTLFSTALLGMEIGQVHLPRERYATFPAWHLDFEIVDLPCPSSE